MTLNSKSVF